MDTLAASHGLSLAALIAALAVVLNARYIANKLKIMDHPDLIRKKHPNPTPLVGGISIMAGVLLWVGGVLYFGTHADNQIALAILFCGAAATLVGYSDDQSSTTPSSRLLQLLLLVALALVLEPRLVPSQLNWVSFPPLALASWVAFALMMIATAGYVNAVNMADGQNGIVTGMYVIWAGCLMLATGGMAQATAQVLFETAFVVFAFNVGGRVFLGDSGTYGVTLVFGILAINAHNNWGVAVETIGVWFFIPVMDCLRLMLTRAVRGGSPTEADNNHFHHQLQNVLGKNGGLIVYLAMVGTMSIVATVLPVLSVWCLILLSAFYFSFAWAVAKGAANVTDSEEDYAETTLQDDRKFRTGSHNVVPIEAKEQKERR